MIQREAVWSEGRHHQLADEGLQLGLGSGCVGCKRPKLQWIEWSFDWCQGEECHFLVFGWNKPRNGMVTTVAREAMTRFFWMTSPEQEHWRQLRITYTRKLESISELDNEEALPKGDLPLGPGPKAAYIVTHERVVEFVLVETRVPG